MGKAIGENATYPALLVDADAVRPADLSSDSLVYCGLFGLCWLAYCALRNGGAYLSNHPYDFSRLATGLVCISPFIGGIIGTAVAGKVSDATVRAKSRRNGGIYESELRLVMGIPVAITTTIGLIGHVHSSFSHFRNY